MSMHFPILVYPTLLYRSFAYVVIYWFVSAYIHVYDRLIMHFTGSAIWNGLGGSQRPRDSKKEKKHVFEGIKEMTIQ